MAKKKAKKPATKKSKTAAQSTAKKKSKKKSKAPTDTIAEQGPTLAKAAPKGSATDNPAAANGWLTCAHYHFVVDRTADDFRFLIEIEDQSGAKHALELDNSSDRPEMGVALFKALQIWPRVDFQFKSDTSKTPPAVTEIRSTSK
jgi:hypothetical protein